MEGFFQRPLPGDGPYGEIWDISALPQHQSRVTCGPHRGRPLAGLWSREARQLTGGRAGPSGGFPLVLKWLECEEFASIQVHPDDALARQLCGEERGKAEAWVVIHADETARVYAGLKPGTTRTDFLRNLERGCLVDSLNSFVPRSGDCISIPAGTVHTAGGGLILAEVQQASDATFRLDDWGRMGLDGRPRPLHIEEALLAIDWRMGPVAPTAPILLAEAPDGVAAEHLLTTPHFRLDRYRVSRLWPAAHSGELTIWMVLDDEAELHGSGDGYRRHFHAGSSVMIPANAEGLFWTPTRPGRSATLLCVRLGAD